MRGTKQTLRRKGLRQSFEHTSNNVLQNDGCTIVLLRVTLSDCQSFIELDLRVKKVSFFIVFLLQIIQGNLIFLDKTNKVLLGWTI